MHQLQIFDLLRNIDFRGLQIAMTEQPLQVKHVSAVSDVARGESMPELMERHVQRLVNAL